MVMGARETFIIDCLHSNILKQTKVPRVGAQSRHTHERNALQEATLYSDKEIATSVLRRENQGVEWFE